MSLSSGVNDILIAVKGITSQPFYNPFISWRVVFRDIVLLERVEWWKMVVHIYFMACWLHLVKIFTNFREMDGKRLLTLILYLIFSLNLVKQFVNLHFIVKFHHTDIFLSVTILQVILDFAA